MNEETWQEAEPAESPALVSVAPATVASDNSSTELPFSELSVRLEDNLASATLKLVDASQDFAGMIRSYVAAGQALEEKIAALYEISATSQHALMESRQAAQDAQAAAKEAQSAQAKSSELIRLAASEHMALVELTDNLRSRIAALAVLGEPIAREDLSPAITEAASQGWTSAA